MSDKDPKRPHTKAQQQDKKAKLSSALRDNLKRRKAPVSADKGKPA